IRAAFGTMDAATIKDTAKDVWLRLGQRGTLFVVADPTGTVIAQGGSREPLDGLPFIPAAAAKLPEQAKGFVTFGDQLYQIVLTPVYVATEQSPALLNVLMVGVA